MRRLPIFFVLDCSESMAGENLQRMEEGIGMIVRSLRQDPHALETVYLSTIAFAGVARTIAPLVELITFYPPKLPIGSGTSLGLALQELMRQMDSVVIKTTAEQKGDWKPVIYLFTDGKPTDKVETAIATWRKDYSHRATLVAIAMGRYADVSALQRLTDTVLLFDDQKDGDFKQFIAWVTASVSSQSKSVGEAQGNDFVLPRSDNKVVTLLKKGELAPPPPSDMDCVVLVGRCQKSRNPYLIKYDRLKKILPLNPEMPSSRFELTGCYPVTDEYFQWSAGDAANLLVSTSDLLGAPGCPYCGNISAFGMCGCGKLLCLNGPGEATCPWCNTGIIFEFGGGFDVQRGRG